jgi:hypothetical protein
MPWLMLFLARLASGERLRKATSDDWRYGAGFFFLLPVYMFALMFGLGGPLLDKNAASIWLFMTAAGVILIFGSYLWVKLVPTKISWLLAAFAWPALLCWCWSHT